jgi:hypothetical protein
MAINFDQLLSPKWRFGALLQGPLEYGAELPGGRIEFKKGMLFGAVVEVKRVPLDFVKPGTRTVFEWVTD